MSDDPTPEDFDFAQWLTGAAGTVRSVRLYSRADLAAEADEIEARLRVLDRVPAEERPIDDEAGRLSRRLDQLAAEFEASAVTVKVQGKSRDWNDAVAKRLKDDGALKGMSDVEQNAEVLLHQVAGAVVDPPGLTVDALRVFRESNQAQVDHLALTYIKACQEAPKVGAPFSQGSSPTRPGRKS